MTDAIYTELIRDLRKRNASKPEEALASVEAKLEMVRVVLANAKKVPKRKPNRKRKECPSDDGAEKGPEA